MRRMAGINRSLKKTRAARARAKRDPERYRVLAEFVLSLRTRLKLTQAQFAKRIGVSEISVRRWESKLGHYPIKATWRTLNMLAKS